MDKPLYEAMLAMLEAGLHETDGRYYNVMRAMREQVEPSIRKLKKEELVIALVEAVDEIYMLRKVLAITEGATDAARDAMREWKLTAGHALHERDGARNNLDTMKNARKANLAKGPEAAAKNRTKVKEKRQSVLVKAIKDMFAKPENPGHHMTNKEIYDFILKNGNPYNYTEKVIFDKVKEIAAECRKKARNEALAQYIS